VAVIRTGTIPRTVAPALGLVITTDGLSVRGRTEPDLVGPDVPAWLIARTANAYVRAGLRSCQT
jgi:hypothetical protein